MSDYVAFVSAVVCCIVGFLVGRGVPDFYRQSPSKSIQGESEEEESCKTLRYQRDRYYALWQNVRDSLETERRQHSAAKEVIEGLYGTIARRDAVIEGNKEVIAGYGIQVRDLMAEVEVKNVRIANMEARIAEFAKPVVALDQVGDAFGIQAEACACQAEQAAPSGPLRKLKRLMKN